MAISINPVDFRGFSLGAPGLPNLPNVGALGLQAIQAQMQSRDNAAQVAAQERMNMARVRSSDEAMLRQNMLDRNKLTEQRYEYDKGNSLDRDKLGLLQGQLGSQMLENTRQNDIASRGLDLSEAEKKNNALKDMQESARENLKLEMAQLKDKKKDEIDAMGAFAVNGRMAMNSIKDPNDARVMQLEILNEAEKNGYINKEVAKQMRQMPISSFKNALEFKILQLDKVKEYQAMNEIQNPKAKGSNSSLEIVQPDGTVVRMQGLDKSARDQSQKDLILANDNEAQLQELYNKVPDNYFGAKANLQKLTKAGEWAEGLPVVGDVLKPSNESKEDLANYTGFKSKADRLALETIKQLSGLSYTDKQLEFLKNVLPSIGPDMVKSEFKGKSEALMNYLEKIKARRQELLDKGININSKEYENQMLETLKQTSSPQADYFKQGLKAKGYSDDEINAFLKSKGM